MQRSLRFLVQSATRPDVIIPHICFSQSCAGSSHLLVWWCTALWVPVCFRARAELLSDRGESTSLLIHCNEPVAKWSSLKVTHKHTHTHTHWRLYAFSSTLCQFAATLAHLHLPNASACCSGFPISGNGESNSLLSKFTVSSFHKRSSMNPSGCSPCVVHLTPMVQMPLRHVHAPKISLLALSFSALLLQLVIWQLKIPLRRM